jgi:hypothetical protein
MDWNPDLRENESRANVIPWSRAAGKKDYEKRLKEQDEWSKNNLWGLISKGGLYDKGVSSLLDLINNPGQTDYGLFNRGIRDIGRGTESSLANSRNTFASRGLGNSSLAMAFQKAISGAGANREQAARENEARRREDLRRQDTDLLHKFILRPNIERYGIDRGISASEGASKDQRNASLTGSAASLVGSLASAFCHTADELYGVGSEEATLARVYMVNHASPETYRMYAKGSKDLAERIKTDPEAREKAREAFDEFVDTARRGLQ